MTRSSRADRRSDRVRRLFDQLAGCSPAEREIRLRDVSSGIGTEVKALLEAYDAHDTSIDDALSQLVLAPLSEAPRPDGVAAAADESDPLIGAEVGPYKIENRVGEGGMGVVYRAWDTRLGRHVALKMLPERLRSDVTAQERLRREARAASGLDHPNVAAVYDVGTADDGRAYVVMAYVEGVSLEDRLRHAPLPITESIDLIRQVVRGLRAVHEAGIVHRDVKPSNLLLTPDGTLKLVDFGIAKMASTDLTQAGAMLGTAAYVSPEQARGEAVDARSDLWGIGVVAFEMLSGVRPFRGTNTPAILRAITCDDPLPLEECAPEVPASLRHIVERLLSKDPTDRFDSASALLDALDGVSERFEVASSESSSGGRPTRPRTPALIGWGATVLGIVVLTLALGWSLWTETSAFPFFLTEATLSPTTTRSTPITVAVLPLEDLSLGEQQAFASGMTEALITTLSQVRTFRVTARRSVIRFAGRVTPPSEIAEELGVDYVIDGAVLQDGDRIRMSVHLLERGSDVPVWTQVYERDVQDVLDLQQDLAQAVAGAVQVELSPQEVRQLTAERPVDPEAYELYLWGQHFRNREYASIGDVRRAYGYFSQAVQKDTTFAAAHAAQVIAGIGFALQGDKESEIRAAAQRALALDSSLAQAHVAQGLVDEVLDWKWVEAESRFRRALALNPSSVDANYEYGLLLLRTGRFEEARPYFEAAEQLDPLSILIQLALVRYYYFTEQYAEALDLLDRALQLDPDHHVIHKEWLPVIHLARGDWPAAVRATERAEEIGGYDRSVPGRLLIAAVSGDRVTAEQYQEEVRAYVERSPEDRPYGEYLLGISEAHLGRLDAAYGHLEEARRGRSVDLVRFAYSPLFAPVRADSRFEAFREAMGMPGGSQAP